MLQLVQSSFLQALGLTIANSLWQMGLLWLIHQLINAIFKPGAAARYALASSAALAGLVWFIASCAYYWNTTTSLADVLLPWNQYQSFGWMVTSVEGLRLMIPYLGFAYLLIVVILAIRLYNSFAQVHQLRRKDFGKAPVEWRIFVKQYSAILNIEKPVQLLLSSRVSSPLTIGFWKPVILLPMAVISQLSPQQLEAVLLHELTHIRRHDYLVNIFLQVAEILLFFNPFMRSILKQAYAERENSCDDWVLQFNYNPKEYATALLAIEQQTQSHVLMLCATGNNKKEFQLLHRIRRMVSPEKNSFNYRSQMWMLALLMAFGFIMQMMVGNAGSKKINALTNNGTTQFQTANHQEESVPVFDLRNTISMLSEVSKSLRIVASDKAISNSEEAKAINTHNRTKVTDLPVAEIATRVVTAETPVTFEEMTWKIADNKLFVPGIEKFQVDLQNAERNLNWITTTIAPQNLNNLVADLNISALKATSQKALSDIRPLRQRATSIHSYSDEMIGMDEASFLLASVLAEQAIAMQAENEILVELARLKESLPKVYAIQTKLAADSVIGTAHNYSYSCESNNQPSAVETEIEIREQLKQESKELQHQLREYISNNGNCQSQAEEKEASKKTLEKEIAARELAIKILEKEVAQISAKSKSVRELQQSENELRSSKQVLHSNQRSIRNTVKKPRVIVQL